jgi:hypothetical protein
MAKQSRVKKYQGQLKRENSLLKRAVLAAQQGQGRATALVLGLLAQAGGDVTLSQDTTNRINTDIARMGYKIEPTPEGLVKVVLVLQEPEPTGPQWKEETEDSGSIGMPQEAHGKIVLTD